MVAPLVRTQLETVYRETSNGTWYSVRNLSGSGHNYFVIDLMGDAEFEISQASCVIGSMNYAVAGQLSFEWEGSLGEWYHSYIWSGYFTNLAPMVLDRTVTISGPCRLVFHAKLDSAQLAYFNCFIRRIERYAR